MELERTNINPELSMKIQNLVSLKDVYAYIIGAMLISLSMAILRAANLTCNGVAGIALTASYIIPVPPGILFGIVNVPFFLFGIRVMGKDFIVRTAIFTLILVFVSLSATKFLHIEPLAPVFAAIFGGTTMGMGVLAVLRHSTGVGGVGIVAYWLGDRRKWNTGVATLVLDVVVVLAGLPVVGVLGTLLSLLGSACSSLVVIIWLRSHGNEGQRTDSNMQPGDLLIE